MIVYSWATSHFITKGYIFCVIFLFILMKSNRIRTLMVRTLPPPLSQPLSSVLCQIILSSFFFLYKFYLSIFIFYLFSIFHKIVSFLPFFFLCRPPNRKYRPFVSRKKPGWISSAIQTRTPYIKERRRAFEKMLLNRVKHFPQHYVMKTTLTNPTVNFRHTLMYLINKKHFSKTLSRLSWGWRRGWGLDHFYFP